MSSEKQKTKTRAVEHGMDPIGVYGDGERDVGEWINGWYYQVIPPL